MVLVHEGDACAFEVVFDRHAGPAFSLAYRMCGRRALAEEIVQEAFMSLWRSTARYDPTRGSVRSWILRVVRLPPDQRQVIELAYFGGFSQAQIAEALGVPAGTVKGRTRLALRKLRIALGEPAGVVP